MNLKRENDEFEKISEWLRSERPPFSEDDRAAMRRAVWREIEARPRPERAFRPARLALAGAAVLVAVLIAGPWLRPSALSTDVPVDAAVTASPEPAGEAVQRPLVRESLGPPATGHLRPNIRLRRTEPANVPVRIEFQTANPEVRIIWLVKKGEAAPGLPSANRHQEVS